MMYRWITTGELIDELEDYTKHITTLALKLEKLARLRSEGKISDTIYTEFHQSICKDIESVRVERQNLVEAANARVKEIGSEVNELKYRLERLEVRHMLDLISNDIYSTVNGELKKKIAEGDEILLLLGKFNITIEEAFSRVDGYLDKGKGQQAGQKPSRLEDVSRESPKSISYFPQGHIEPLNTPIMLGKITEKLTKEEEKPIKEPKESLNHEVTLSKMNTIKCPRCGMENLSIAAYCFKCRATLSDAHNLWSRP